MYFVLSSLVTIVVEIFFVPSHIYSIMLHWRRILVLKIYNYLFTTFIQENSFTKMKAYLFVIITSLSCYSCSDNSLKYTGVFENTNKTAFAREMRIIHIKDDKYKISFLDGLMIEEGKRNENRITAKILVNNKMSIDIKSFYDFRSDCNSITISSEGKSSVETYTRVK